MTLRVGLDLGSTAIKVALLDGDRAVQLRCVPTAPGQEALARVLVRSALEAVGADESRVSGVAATGYGKRLYPAADRIMDEISANALGAHRASGGAARVVVNVGGQDLKVIRLTPDGRVADFAMNDKCAAGTGRFFETASRILDTPLTSFGALAAEASDAAEINNTCVVFAESEIVALLSRGVPRGEVIRGLCASVARRAAAFLGSPSDGEGLYLDGGPALNPELARALAAEMMLDVRVLEHPQYTVALGAAYSL
jgi:predicted CoA-substrate-specific enzyme activase